MGTTKPFGVRDNWVLVDSMVDTYCEIAEEAFGSFCSIRAIRSLGKNGPAIRQPTTTR